MFLTCPRVVLGYRNGYSNGYIGKYLSDTVRGYIGKYSADTKVRTVVRYLANGPNHAKRMAVTRQLVKRYESRSSGERYEKQQRLDTTT